MTKASFAIRIAAAALALCGMSPAFAAKATSGTSMPVLVALSAAAIQAPAPHPAASDEWAPLQCERSGSKMVC